MFCHQVFMHNLLQTHTQLFIFSPSLPFFHLLSTRRKFANFSTSQKPLQGEDFKTSKRGRKASGMITLGTRDQTTMITQLRALHTETNYRGRCCVTSNARQTLLCPWTCTRGFINFCRSNTQSSAFILIGTLEAHCLFPPKNSRSAIKLCSC